jgi:hypothetical protein
MTKTAVQYIIEEFSAILGPNIQLEGMSYLLLADAAQKAKDMEKKQMKDMYNLGYEDCQCNHINDADNTVEEYLYSKDN